jgi:hypothetical protein
MGAVSTINGWRIVVRSDVLEALLYWVREREAIRLRKELGGSSFPWTDDSILQNYRFCCVRREDDRVTRWIKTNIRERFVGHEHLWFMLCTARMVNWPPTLQVLMERDGPYPGAWPGQDVEFRPENMGNALEDLKSMNLKVFTGAYIIPAPTVAGQTKGRYVAEVVLGNLWQNKALHKWMNSPFLQMEGVHNILMRQGPGWGPFLTYQAIVDMRFTDILRNARDVSTWCACGPGTTRGLNRLYGRPLTARASQAQMLEEVRALHPLILRETGVEHDFSDVPNILCETDKFLRVKNGEGTPRARYVPGRGH